MRTCTEPGQSAKTRESPPPRSDQAPARGRAGRPRDPHRSSPCGPRTPSRGRPRRACRRAPPCRPSTAALPAPAMSWSRSIDGVDFVLPVAREVTTAVAYHPVDNADAVPFAPAGDRLSGGSLGQQLADIFAGGGAVQYYLMAGTGGERSSSTAGLDVGAVPGSAVVSPVGRQGHRHQEVPHPRPLRRRRDRHPARAGPVAGAGDHPPRARQGRDRRRGGARRHGARRGAWVPATLDQALSRYTSDTGDHVQLMVLRVTPELAGP